MWRQGCENGVEQFVAHALCRCRIPFRVIVFVDDHRAHTLGKIGADQYATADSIFHAHIVSEIIKARARRKGMAAAKKAWNE